MKAVQVGAPGTAKVSDVGEPKLRGPQDAIVKVTAAAIEPLSSMKNLRQVYLYNTPAQPAPASEQASPIAKSAP